VEQHKAIFCDTIQLQNKLFNTELTDLYQQLSSLVDLCNTPEKFNSFFIFSMTAQSGKWLDDRFLFK